MIITVTSPEQFALLLANWRAGRRVSMDGAGRRAGVSPKTIGNWERRGRGITLGEPLLALIDSYGLELVIRRKVQP